MNKHKKETYAAVLRDCEELLDILETKEVKMNFDVFAEAWKEKMFSFIFWGKRPEKEVEGFIDDLFLVAKTFWLPPNNTKRRLYAAYLIYGLYYMQPVKNAHKYKVTLREWKEITNYFEFVKSHDLPEHFYMFCKLMHSRAFDFTATLYDINLGQGPGFGDITVNLAGCSGKPNTLESLVSDELFESITTSETQYEEAKRQLLKGAFDVAAGLADVASKDFGQKLHDICIGRLQQENDQAIEAAVPVETVTAPETDEIGKRRVVLKKRLLGCDADKAEESARVTEDKINGTKKTPPAKKKCRERGYKLLEKFKDQNFPDQGDVNYSFHTKATRFLHYSPMHNCKTETGPRRRNRRVGDKPRLRDLQNASTLVRAAKRRFKNHRLWLNQEEQEQIASVNDMSNGITSQHQNSAAEEAGDGSEITDRMSNMELEEEENTNIPQTIVPQTIIPTEENNQPEISAAASLEEEENTNIPQTIIPQTIIPTEENNQPEISAAASLEEEENTNIPQTIIPQTIIPTEENNQPEISAAASYSSSRDMPLL